MTRTRTTAYLLLTVTSLFWAGNMVMSRGLRADLPPVALAFWRWVVAFACVLPLALPHLRSQWPALRASGNGCSSRRVRVGCYNTFSYVAVQYDRHQRDAAEFLHPCGEDRAGLSVPRQAVEPDGSARRADFLLGVAVISRGSVEVLLGLTLNTGDIWMLVAVLSWSIYGGSAVASACPPDAPACAFIVVGLAVMAPMYLWELSSVQRSCTWVRSPACCMRASSPPSSVSSASMPESLSSGLDRFAFHPPSACVCVHPFGADPRRGSAVVSLRA